MLRVVIVLVEMLKMRGKSLEIREYLLNPHKVGVYCCNFETKIDHILRLLEETVNFDRKEKREPDVYNTLRYRDSMDTSFPWLLDDFKDALSHLDIYKPKNPPLGPWKLRRPYKRGLTEKETRFESILDERYRNMVTRYPSASKFLERDHAILDNENAANLDFSISQNSLRLSVYSIRKQGIDAYRELLKSIPIIGKSIKASKTLQRFSSRYCYRVYPSAVVVWACEITDDPIPSDILQYFLGAVSYYERKEWRISIVLSAIAVEIILAELYEEVEHEQAPPDTLGSLFSKLSKKIKFPDKVKADVEEVNNNRILSVHRSSMQLGDREARTSLVGATRFADWSYFCGPFSK